LLSEFRGLGRALLARYREQRDNQATIKTKSFGFVRLRSDRGASLIYLPPEQSFAKLKAHLRKAKERTVPAIYDRIGQALGTFRASEFPNYFRKSGYAPI
jgi:hypothetical protein